MSVATAETHELHLAEREQPNSPAPAPVNLSERAARAVKEIVNDQRIGCLTALAPELVAKYNELVAKESHSPSLSDLAASAGASETELLVKFGAIAYAKSENLTPEMRELQRELTASTGHAPTSAELAARAGTSENELLAKIGASAATILGPVYLRLRVVGGGCSGFQNKLDLDPAMNPKTDESFELHGVPVAVDKRSIMYLNGVEVDYHDDLNRRGFSIKNPSAKTTCGCGSSFSM